MGHNTPPLEKIHVAASNDIRVANERAAVSRAKQAQTQLLNLGYEWQEQSLTWVAPKKPWNSSRYKK